MFRELLRFDWRPIGVTDAAVATRELLNAIPLDNGRISCCLADWIDTQPDIVSKARELDNGLNQVDKAIWDFMKDTTSDTPDLEVPTRTASIAASVAEHFRSSADASA